MAAIVAILPSLLSACSGNYPNSTFQHTTEFNRDLTSIWNTMMFWAVVVFVLVEGLLILAMIRYRRRPNSPEPQHVHGNTVMEIAWTVTPAVILAFIAVPTVRAIWKYEAPAANGALQVEVIGHQWWWEFKYPQYGLTTANELYLPVGRTVNFSLHSADVIHSFWIPGLGGKRDAIYGRINHLWFTPDSAGVNGWIGSCNEYCGTSHANMRFRVFTVAPADFESWMNHQKGKAVFPVASAVTPAPAATGANAATPAAAGQPKVLPTAQATSAPNAGADMAAPAIASAAGYVFPLDKVPAHLLPKTPIPAGLTFTEGLTGDAQRGFELYSRSACIGCHKVEGNPSSIGVIGPNLTHVGSRITLAGGLFPNDDRHMSLWIKNSRKMKPGVIMNTQGKGEYDPILKATVSAGGLTDQQIADVVAYLKSLK